MKKTKKRLWILIAIAAVVLIGLFFVCSGRFYFRSPVILLPDPQRVTTTNRNPSVPGGGTMYSTLREVSGGGATPSLTRDQALEIYAGNVMQLDANCRAKPVTMSIPRKSIVMFDNESQWQRTIIVGPRTYMIDPFDYVLASFNVPGTFAVTCDSVQAVSLIQVQ